MTNPVTPNIGLNKIDRTSPSTTYFDLEKYIDQNADAVDRYAGESSEAIGALEKRLNTEERREVVLQPGLQIVNAERSAPFKLSGIKGRTLVNLLGRDGDCESISGWTHNTSTISIDASNKVYGSNSLKVTVISGGNGQGTGYRQIAHLIDRSKYYVAVVDVKSAMGAESRLVLEVPGKINVDGTPVTDTEKFSPSFLGIKPSDIEGTGSLVLHGLIRGSVGDVSYFDGFRIYEITQSEYNKLGAMTTAQVAAKYPYVDSVQPVRNPYAIRYGENLLPPFYEWSHVNNKGKILSPYSYLQPEYDNGAWSNVLIPVMPFTDYVISFENIGDSKLRVVDNKTPLSILLDLTSTGGTFNSGDNTTVSVYISAGTVGQVNNPMLTVGTEAQPFKPREDSMLALQTDLYADPLTGANADEVFEKDGHYFKLAKWKRLIFDSSHQYGYFNSYSGGKCVRLLTDIIDRNKTTQPFVAKYNGFYLKGGLPSSAVDLYSTADWAGGATGLGISVSSADSGWGDNYTPTPDEIKAYFMGWKMYLGGQADVSQPYNGTGSKAWCPLDSMYSSGSLTYATHYTSTLPTASTTTLLYSRYTQWTPYQLVYQLATPTVDPIVTEGMLTINEGDNQIEVGTGLVVRENAKPHGSSTYSGYYINENNVFPASKLRYQVRKILGVYKNSQKDVWRITSGNAYGTELAFKPYADYDPSAAYSVTYLMLDKSPIAPFTGSYSANEKAILQELTDAVQQNATAVSALTNRKVDKSASDWIIPTLMNSWVSTADAAPLRYMKDSNGAVRIVGRVSKGAISNGILLFVLPEGYKPSVLHIFASLGTGDTGMFPCEITVNPDGFVQMWSLGGNKYVDVCLPSFLAEK